MHKGQDGNCAYLIQSGRVKVFTKTGSKEVVLANLGPGQIFGEMALILDQKRSASVMAVEDTTVIIISRIAFEKKLSGGDATIRAVTRMMMKRVADTTRSLLAEQSKFDKMVDQIYDAYQELYENLPRDETGRYDEKAAPEFKPFVDKMRAFITRYKR